VEDGLEVLGWSDHWRVRAAEHPELTFGRVIRVDRGMASVATSPETEHRLMNPAEPIAVGDWVGFRPSENDEPATIEVVLERKSHLRRLAAGERQEAQLVAANIDHVLICQSLASGANLRRLERELVVAWDSGAHPVVLFTKADLVEDPGALVDEAVSVTGGIQVIAVSTVSGVGLDEVRALFAGNATVVALGASGTGKSTLVNALVGRDVQDTGVVREDDQRGRHTTTAGALILLPGGGIYLDTPGIRAVGLFADADSLAAAFSDIDDLAETCRFRDCSHDQEPGCAVQQAVDDGQLDRARLESWRKLQRELVLLADDRAGWEKAAANQKRRVFSKAVRKQPYRP
jgi:ribosome biogenesis GTPase